MLRHCNGYLTDLFRRLRHFVRKSYVPKCSDFMIASHVSKESCTADILKILGKKAPINADMCLGEGTGGMVYAYRTLIPHFAYITKCLLLTILTLKAIRSLNNVYTCNRRKWKRKV